MFYLEVVGKGVGGLWKVKFVGIIFLVLSFYVLSFFVYVGNVVDIIECFLWKYFVDMVMDLM